MPLATKNGSLILKSGSLAENCNCCGSGWYCCRQFPTSSPLCSPLSFIGKVTAVVTSGQDYRLEKQVVNAPCLAPVFNQPPASSPFSGKFIAINPTSHYAGTHELAAPASGGTWLYTYPPDGAGNSAYLSLSVTATSGGFTWSLSFGYHFYYWEKLASSMPSDTKTLADMTLGDIKNGTGTPSNCFTSPGEWFGGRLFTFAFNGSRTTCAASESRNYTDTMSSFTTQTSRFPDAYTSVVSQMGSLDVSINLSIELK